ncbi:MAG: hypothetical protein WKF78_13255 [Candidatus Limnocylindrales bacterium]
MLEERDVQIRGFTVRLRARSVRRGLAPTRRTTRRAAGSSRRSRTGWVPRSEPTTRARWRTRSRIVAQEKQRFAPAEAEPTVVVPAFMEELVAELTHLARRSPEISQRSGVSVRVSVANMEILEAVALKRAVRLGRVGRRTAGLGPRRDRGLDRGQGRTRVDRATRRPRSASSNG